MQPSDIESVPHRFSWKRRTLSALAVAGAVALYCGCGLPETPHAVGAVADDSCLQCHRHGDYDAGVLDHPDRSHCVSCHQVSDFRPIPHSLALSNCLSCHELAGGRAPVTSHPERPECARCHASAVD